MPTKPPHYVDKLQEVKVSKLTVTGLLRTKKKLGGVAINGMAISVNELANGSSLTAINDVSRELEKLRKTGH